jgi:hypothetical protein
LAEYPVAPATQTISPFQSIRIRLIFCSASQDKTSKEMLPGCRSPGLPQGNDGMLRIDKKAKKLVRLANTVLAQADHWERQLQGMIYTSPDAFCEEIGENLLVIGQEVRPSEAVPDRIDILAIDDLGTSVVIELKRGSHKLQLLQATSYAGMIFRWTADRFVDTLSSNTKQTAEDARAAIEEHSGLDIVNINHEQRVMLIAEDFDPALLIATEWLHENYSVDIRCYRIQLSQENSIDYMTCTRIYPPVETTKLTRGSQKIHSSEVLTSWDEVLGSIENIAVKEFVQKQLDKKQESNLPHRQIIYRVDGKRRFFFVCRRKYAYIWQLGRFEGDETHWKKVLSEPAHVQEVNGKKSLRFHLTSATDFIAFIESMEQYFPKVEFLDNDDSDQPPDVE